MSMQENRPHEENTAARPACMVMNSLSELNFPCEVHSQEGELTHYYGDSKEITEFKNLLRKQNLILIKAIHPRMPFDKTGSLYQFLVELESFEKNILKLKIQAELCQHSNSHFKPNYIEQTKIDLINQSKKLITQVTALSSNDLLELIPVPISLLLIIAGIELSVLIPPLAGILLLTAGFVALGITLGHFFTMTETAKNLRFFSDLNQQSKEAMETITGEKQPEGPKIGIMNFFSVTEQEKPLVRVNEASMLHG
jgi:hypothetical protein